MRKIEIDATPLQEFFIAYEGDYIKITLSFRQRWFLSVKYKDKEVNGLKLASGALMLQGKNLPFEIYIDDKGLGVDPFSVDCFERGLFDFLLLERDEITALRGYEVE